MTASTPVVAVLPIHWPAWRAAYPVAARAAILSRLVENAHAAGLKVHAWTFRAENMFLPVSFRRGTDLAGHGDMAAEVRLHVEAGVDGLFCDHPDVARGVLPPAPRA